ncbi:hypothetical protein P167DRAFT_535008 [Morchella conica CCBAS932]|uniref:Zn(2)-C6 fungal-type domain-containing protein n=1 Tax=Morchella conica CCBAS932 TaxID=1392247 RepID=A0A3N4KRS0_9PEZI|nr:hypothetical protein P167DRAFT_535008 [Morchella conica CCBAS932]
MEAKETNRTRKSPGARGREYRRSPTEARQSSDRDGNIENDSRGEASEPPKLYHTLTACTRCRTRKTRCDAGLPKCGPCERSGAHCEFFDSTKQKTIPRSYVVHLQAKVRALEEEIKMREALTLEVETPNIEDLVRGVAMVNFADYEHYKEPRYVGTSNGFTVTRLVLESAKRNLGSQTFKDLTTQHRRTFRHALRSSPDPENHYHSSVPATKLPNREITDKLVDRFCQKALYQLPVLHEPTFIQDVADVYSGSIDPYKNFQLKMVLAISMQRLSRQYATIADSYFLAGLEHLEEVLESMDHRTLQCLLVMAQYALVTPTRMAVYHIVGIAVRLCMQLGYHQERTIMLSENPLDCITKDMRRRFFWSLASMEYGLSHVLGRPSSFATADSFVDVGFYETVDDTCITVEGILPGPPSPKKLISMHFFRMRRLQAEIRQTLYQNPRENPKSDEDPWFHEMSAKLDNWRATCPQNDQGSGMSYDWFDHRYHLMRIFLFHPTPQIPQPSLEATILCYDSSVKGIHLQKKMFDEKTIEFTWVYLHQIYTATLTLIWALYNEGIRELHSKEEVESNFEISLSLLTVLAERWPGTEAAADLFDRLARAALQSYTTYQGKSPVSTHSSIPSHSTATSPSPQKESSPLHRHSSPYASSPSVQSVEETTPSPAASWAANYIGGSHLFENNPSRSASGAEVPQALQDMMFSPHQMYGLFGSGPGAGTRHGIPAFVGAWDPVNTFPQHTMAAQAINPLVEGSPIQQPDGSSHDHRVLNQQQQQSELMSILETEAMETLDDSRPWVPDYDEHLHFY